jgi:hypothetical protein
VYSEANPGGNELTGKRDKMKVTIMDGRILREQGEKPDDCSGAQ